MSRVEELIKASRGFARVWKEFIESFHKNPEKLYCFFEGRDDVKYYGSRIDAIVFSQQVTNRYNLWCDGKDNLKEVCNLVITDKRYEKSWVAFFLDSDFENYNESQFGDFLYITPCYSVENLYVSETSFERLLRDEFPLRVDEPDFINTIVLYEQMLNAFNEVTTELNAWINIHRDRELRGESLVKLNLKDISEDSLFRIRLTEIVKIYDLTTLNSLFDTIAPVTTDEINTYVNKYNGLSKSKIFRGKYLISFLKKFLSQLSEDSNKRRDRQHFSVRRAVALSVSGNILSELSQYADTPESLNIFLQRLAQNRPQQLLMEGI